MIKSVIYMYYPVMKKQTLFKVPRF